MRRTGNRGVCLVVSLALSGVTTVGADASTEVVNGCIKVQKGAGKTYHGHYLDKSCTVKASAEEVGLGGKANKYELGIGAKWSAKGNVRKHGVAVQHLEATTPGRRRRPNDDHRLQRRHLVVHLGAVIELVVVAAGGREEELDAVPNRGGRHR